MRGLVPAVRLILGGVAVVACVLAPRSTVAGILFQMVLGLAMVVVARPPRHVVARAIGLGALLYIPLVLILVLPHLFVVAGPPADAPATGGFGPGNAAAGGGIAAGGLAAGGLGAVGATAGAIALKGAVTLLIALSTLATLRRAELHTAVAGLPLPRTVRLLILQILHQTALLLDETVRIRWALAVRAPARRGVRSLRLVAALPRVWLERVTARAERTALALELRGYHLHGASPLPPPPARRRADAVAVAAAIFALACALALHLVG